MATHERDNRSKINEARMGNALVDDAFDEEVPGDAVVRPLSDAVKVLLGDDSAEFVRFGADLPSDDGPTPLHLYALTQTGIALGRGQTGSDGFYEARWFAWRDAFTWGFSGKPGIVRVSSGLGEDRPQRTALEVWFQGRDDPVALPTFGGGNSLKFKYEELIQVLEWIRAERP